MRCTKNIFFAILFFVTGLNLFSQSDKYNNRWINHSQKYFKIKIPKDGIYRLDSATLASTLSSTGIALNTIDPQNIQLFQKGKEIYPYVAGESDGVFNASDYILFYAEKNTAKDDSLLYTDTLRGAGVPEGVPFLTNPFYSVINDSATVFLTWNNLTSNHRLTLNTDTAYSTYTASPYYYKEVHTPFTDYNLGPLNIVNQSDPRYKLGEGIMFTSFFNPVYEGTSAGFSITTSAVYKSTPRAFITLCISGGNDIDTAFYDHLFTIDYTDNTGNPQVLLDSESVNAYTTRKYVYTIDPATFNPTTTAINVNNLINPHTSIDNFVYINYISAFYPQTFNMLSSSEERMYLPDDLSQGGSKLVLSNFTGTSPVMIDVTNHRLLTLTASGSNFLSIVPNSGGSKICYLADQTAVTNVSKIVPVNRTSTPGSFVKYFASGVQDSAYIIISHPKLMYAAGVHGVSDYKNWRASGAFGGNFNVVVASTEDLADQYGYGVDYNVLAIRNFCAHLIDTAAASSKRAPSNLFLMGKGIHPVDVILGLDGYPASYFANKCLVPTWGNPSSDNLITQGLKGSLNLEPAIPTGRLAAQNDGDVLAYLSKAELHEQQTDDSLWKKQAIHFVGGNTYTAQSTFSNYMNVCKAIYVDTSIGGRVFTFKKTSSAPVSTTTNDSVRQLINAGVSLITFFGHGSPTGFDENIDDPSTYNNSPHFPLILANSCFTGDINNGEIVSHSELFTLAPNNHGGIGYIATVTEGVANYLIYYSIEMYKQFSYKNYGKSYGTSIKNTVRQVVSDLVVSSAKDSILILTALEMTLHGDPAIGEYGFSKPDYTLKNSDVILTPMVASQQVKVKIIMTNLGRAVKDSMVVLLQRTFPNGDVDKKYIHAKAPYYKDTLSFFVPLDYYRAVGLNSFCVTLDFGGTITEIDEANNVACVNLFIKGSDIEPVWPYKYGIVPNLASVILKASTADPFAPDTVYRFQVDTNDAFSSLLVNTTVHAPGGVVSLPVTLLNKDSVVYYWRVSKDGAVPDWKESSFQVLTGKYGWGQAHFNQFKNDFYQYVRYNKPNRKFDFYNTVKTIAVNDVVCWGAAPNNNLNFTDIQFFYDGNQERIWSCAPGGWSIACFNPITGILTPATSPVSVAPATNGNPPGPTYWGLLGDCICDLTTMSVTDFGNYNKCETYDPAFDYRDSLATFINNIPDSTWVLAYTVKVDIDMLSVNTNMKMAFQGIGSTKINQLSDTTTLIIFGKKGWPVGRAHEMLSNSRYDLLTFKDSIVPHFTNGFIESELIGPCKSSDTAWKSLHWNFHSLDSTPGDSIAVQLIGIDTGGVKHIITSFNDTTLNVLNLSSYVSGKTYPYLQLIAYQADKINTTPPQLARWQVIFDQAPECALHPPAGFSVKKNPVAEGEGYEARIPIKNISDFKFDSNLVITYNVQDVNRVSHPLPYKLKNKPFLPDAVIMDTVQLSTLGYSGSNVLWVDVNPPKHPKYQAEQFHFNNVCQIGFDVNRDRINPMLDVTFDGIHILNRDIVSSKPVVLVSLKDENKFLALNDTSNFLVSILYPGASKETKLFFHDNTLLFTPAMLPNNSCKINYHPILPQDGTYMLHIQSRDRSGNVSGQYDYKIQFDVVNKPSITEVLNYPNPFSTSTKFVFTVTGSEVPETFKIQIITITGKVVKEITRDELGFIHIGRNITDYAWDGKDQFGDQLANGVYLYRVQTRLHDAEIDLMHTDADSYFKKGYGKMLLMR
jgi:hypothetical protein